MSAPKAIVLFSGGLDSTTCLAIARSEGFTPIALSLRYGQRHTVELDCAARLASSAGVEHIITEIDLAAFGGSALVDAAIAVPKHHGSVAGSAIGSAIGSGAGHGSSSVPVTYVPARNTVFLAIAMAVAETHGSDDVFIGVNAVDLSLIHI